MDKSETVTYMQIVAKAKVTWAKAITNFNTDVDWVIKRLIHEATRNFMSVDQVAKETGLSERRVRAIMREMGLNPKHGRALLATKAAKALETNAELMGIEPKDMDLTSPLAYLPMGSKLKESLAHAKTAPVYDLDDEFPETVHGINYFDHEIGCRISGYDDPVLITNDVDKITCAACQSVLVKS